MNARIPDATLNAAQALRQISQQWDDDLVGQLAQYIAIPAKSPMFDPDWAKNGYIDAAPCRELGGGAAGAGAENRADSA